MTFTKEKNKSQNKPIWLYRIHMDDESGEADLFFTSGVENVSFFKTDNGVDSPQVYTRFPITHEGIEENSEGRIDAVAIQIANASREIQYYVETYDGLRGKRVTVRRVFEGLLADPSAYIEYVFHIDSCAIKQDFITFGMTSKLDILSIDMPKRRYLRDFCQWTYKGPGCWLDNGDGTYSAPSGFAGSDQVLFNTREIVGDNGATSTATSKFLPVYVDLLSKDDDFLIIEMKATAGITADSYLRLASNKGGGEWWTLHDLTGSGWNEGGLSISGVYQQFLISLNQFTVESGGLDLKSGINMVRLFSTLAAPGRVYWKQAFLRYGGVTGSKDYCRKFLRECYRHNNVSRYGGFPSIPKRKTFMAR